MKTFLVYIVVVFCCGIGTFFIYRHIQASHFNSTAVPYIYEVLPKISSWNPDLLDQIIAPEILRQTDRADLVRLMASLSRLGTLETIGVPRFRHKATTGSNPEQEKEVVTYLVEGVFSRGPAKITLSLLQDGSSYRVYHFNFQSEALGP